MSLVRIDIASKDHIELDPIIKIKPSKNMLIDTKFKVKKCEGGGEDSSFSKS